jgi:hypothetical protein
MDDDLQRETENKMRQKEINDASEMEKSFRLFHPKMDNEHEIIYRCRIWDLIGKNYLSLNDHFRALIHHLLNNAMDEAIMLVESEPILLTMTDEFGLYPLHHAIKGHDTYKAVVAFIDGWLQFESEENLSQMEFLHFAVKNKAPFDVIYYLTCKCPSSTWTKGKKCGYTPLMYALEGEQDMSVIKCVSYSSDDYVGDYDRTREHFYSHRKTIHYTIGQDSFIDSEMTMFRLEHNDPMLTTLVLGDRFHLMDEEQGTSLMEVLHALYMNDHVTNLLFAYDDDEDDPWWAVGPSAEAIRAILRDKSQIEYIAIRSSTECFSVFSYLLQQCPQLKRFFCASDRESTSEYGIKEMMKTLTKTNPLLEYVSFEKVKISYGSDNFFVRMLKMPSIKEVCMINTDMEELVAGNIVSRMKRYESKFEHLNHVTFFYRASSRDSDCRDWKDKIECELQEITNGNLQKSVDKFMEGIHTMERQSDLQLIYKMVEANTIDDDVDSEEISHLYALIRSKPDLVKRAVDRINEKTFTNKRQKKN